MKYNISCDDIKYFSNWFDRYTKSYKLNAPDDYEKSEFDVKIVHTRDVRNISIAIGKSLDLKEDEIRLADTIALFHDVGRFEQFRIYKNFRDSPSYNHAICSCRILKQKKLLKKLNKLTAHTILTAIGQHNKKEIYPGINPEYLLFSKLLRDSDKISLFPFFIENLPIWESKKLYLIKGDISDQIADSLLKKEVVDSSLIKTYDDLKALILSWFDSIYLQASEEYIKKGNYKIKIFNLMTESKTKERIRTKLF